MKVSRFIRVAASTAFLCAVMFAYPQTLCASEAGTEKCDGSPWEPVPEDDDEIFQVVEEMPEFPGGMAECMKFIAKNIQYPAISQENGVQGKVIVRFVVNKDGSVSDAEVARSVDPYLDKEALRIIGQMPKWKPGKQRGELVRVRYTVPVTFRLQ